MNFAHTRFYKAALIGLAILLLLGVSQSQRALNRQRVALGLTRGTDLKGAPPVLAFTTVALGGFRGLIANVLWVRANDLQEEDKFFEMVQLADWITKLEPHFVHVWLVQAWNMAYNISIKFPEPADRWRWVQAGLELLRDHGLEWNPDEPLIYRELAWFFQHKMGQNLDDAHMYFKEAWRQEMQQVLGESGPPNFDELINPQNDEAKKRTALLREKYKMDPRKMKELDGRYGPLEWRLPETHAIYWASLGLDKTKGQKELIVLRRVIYQSMQLAFQRGRLIQIKSAGSILFGPNLAIIPRTSAAYEEAIEQDVENRDHIKRAHRNFLMDAIYFLYVNNRLADANRWFKTVRDTYPEAHLEGRPLAKMSLDDYALGRYGVDITETDNNRVKAMIQGLYVNAFTNLAIDEDDTAAAQMNMAQKIWERFQEQIDANKNKTQNIRVGLPPLSELKKLVLNDLLDPEKGLSPQLRAILRTKLNLPAPTNAPPAVTLEPKKLNP